MRKLLISLAAAGAALIVASPAAAQYYPGEAYGYGSNGYGNYYGQARALQARIDAVQWQIKRLDRYNVVRDGTANRLREESRSIERRLHNAERYGLNPYEANDIQARIARLESRVQYASANRYGRYGASGYNGGYGYNGYGRGDHDGDHDWNDDHDRR